MNAHAAVAVVLEAEAARCLWSAHLTRVVAAKAPGVLGDYSLGAAAVWTTLVQATATARGIPVEAAATYLTEYAALWGDLPSLQAIIDHDPED